MQNVLSRLGDMGPSVAVLLIAGGLTFGLFGWRMVRYLVVADALVAALLCWAVLDGMKDGAEKVILARVVTLGLAIGPPWLAWRCHRIAIAAVGGAIWFFLPQCMLADTDVPLLVRGLLGLVGGSLASAAHLTLRREAAVVTTGLHGGWLCLAAFVVVAADPQSFGRHLLDALSSHALWLPLVAIVLSAIMISLQWADMTRSMDPEEGL